MMSDGDDTNDSSAAKKDSGLKSLVQAESMIQLALAAGRLFRRPAIGVWLDRHFHTTGSSSRVCSWARRPALSRSLPPWRSAQGLTNVNSERR